GRGEWGGGAAPGGGGGGAARCFCRGGGGWGGKGLSDRLYPLTPTVSPLGRGRRGASGVRVALLLGRVHGLRAHLTGDLRHVAAEDGRQVGVHDRGVAAADQLDQRRHFVAHP